MYKITFQKSLGVFEGQKKMLTVTARPFLGPVSTHTALFLRHSHVPHGTTRGSSNIGAHKMRLPALPKLPQSRCSNPLNSTAISPIQFNQSGWGWWRGISAPKYAMQFTQI